MQLPKDLLAEKNYTGTRLIEITDPRVKKMQEELDALQKEVNPTLDRLSKELYAYLDPLHQEIQKYQEKIKEIRDKATAKHAEFAEETRLLETTDQKAQLIKNKLQPLILSLVEGDLEEFEEAKHTVVKDGKIYVEVYDVIEEKIKAHRAVKAKK